MKGKGEGYSTPLDLIKSSLSEGSTKRGLLPNMRAMPNTPPLTGVLDDPRAKHPEAAKHFRTMRMLPPVPTLVETLPKAVPRVDQPGVILDESAEAHKLGSNLLQYLPASGEMIVAMHHFAWSGLNFVTVSGLTSAAVLSVKSPIQTMVLTLMKESVLIPGNVVGMYSCAKFLYAGTRAQLAGAGARTAYLTEAKDVKPADEARHIQTAYVMGIAWGELLVTQPSEALSTFNKARILPAGFNWKTPSNFSSLMMAGIGPRYCSGLINLSALCVLTDILKEHIPGNREFAAASAGAGAGVLAAVASHPFSALKDYTLLQSKFEAGKLRNASTVAIIKKICKQLQAHPKETLCLFFNKNTGKQIGLKMMNTAMIFSIMAGVEEFLSREPLDKVIPAANPNRFFSPTSNHDVPSIAPPANEKQQEDQSSGLKQ